MTDDQMNFILYDKMGCSLQVKIDNRGRGEVTAKVLFLEKDSDAAVNALDNLVVAALRKMKAEEHYQEDDGELKLGSDELMEDEDDEDEFGVRFPGKKR